MNAARDTIAAIATAPGRGGVGIVRVSGPAVPRIAITLLGREIKPRLATHAWFLDAGGEALDDGIALLFPAPHSFTGEDVLELQGHGGPVVLDTVLHRVLELGARPARAGEFTERAFLNDKLDLAQAEAVADLIDAGSREAAQAALRSLDGVFSRRVQEVLDALIALRVYIEAALDFPEEEIDFLADTALIGRLDALSLSLDMLLAEAAQGVLLREGMHVVIAGQPNAGKSSLLNALAGRERAIVTELPGTTRDVLREEVRIDGLPVHIIDTAGLRDSTDVVEREGIRRAWAEIERADRILLVIDDSAGLVEADRAILSALPQGIPVTLVRNKIDLTGRAPGCVEGDSGVEIALSARGGVGLAALRAHLVQAVGYRVGEGGQFSARRRHLDALERTRAAVICAREVLIHTRAGELCAEELRLAQHSLGEITGSYSADDLLGEIFGSFCIGK